VNRLWVRLSIAFSAVVLLGVLMLVLIASIVGQAEAQQTGDVRDLFHTSNGLIDRLTDFYRTHGTWDGVGIFLEGAESVLIPAPRSRMVFTLMDADRRIVYDAQNTETVGQMTSLDADTIRLVVNDQTVGFLNFRRVFVPLLGKWAFGAVGSFALQLAAVGGVLGIVFGVLMSRGLTAPLNRLAEAAQAIGAGKQYRHVEVSGSVEIAALATAFNDMADALEKAESVRRNMVADVAHELRTPLSVLQGNLRAVLDGVYPLENAEIARLYDQTRVLSRLVNDLHDLTLAEARQLPLNLQSTNLRQVIDSVVKTFGPVAETEHVTLAVHIDEPLPAIMGDSVRLMQVLHNLLANALRYTPPGGEIEVLACLEDKAVCLIVKDTGDGIPQEHLPHVFERFYRADKARSRVNGGSGLGLAIVRAIVEAHGAHITVRSQGIAGQGTTFSIQFLPAAA